MRPTHEQSNDFFAHKPLPNVAFAHNDAVEVIAGEHVGDSGSLVSVEELGDDLVYLVELSSGNDAYINQSFLRLYNA